MRQKKVLLVFPGLSIQETAGAKHRLNSYIDAYTKTGYEVWVLGFFKDNPFSSRRQLNSNAKWILLPFILPMTKMPLCTSILMVYLKCMFAIVTWLVSASIIQMEMYSLRSRWCNPQKRYITDVHGDSLYEFMEMGRGDIKHWYAKRLLQIQKDNIKFSDRIICVSENLKKQLEANTGMKINDYRIISCGVDLDRYQVEKAELPVDISNRIVVGYSGGMDKWQRMDDIIKISTLLHEKDNRIFLIIYTMGNVEKYQDMLERLGNGNYYIKSLRSNEVPSHLKVLDAGFLVRDNLIMNKVSSPTKIPEYLAARAALICTEYSGDYEVYCKNRNNCFVLNREDRFKDIVGLLEWLHYIKDNKPDNSFLTQYTFQNQFERSKVDTFS